MVKETTHLEVGEESINQTEDEMIGTGMTGKAEKAVMTTREEITDEAEETVRISLR